MPSSINAKEHLRNVEIGGLILTEFLQPRSLEVPRHFHQCATVLFTIRGFASDRIGGRAQECHPSSVLVRPAGENHTHYYGHQGIHGLVVEIRPERVAEIRSFSTILDCVGNFKEPLLSELGMRLYAETRIWTVLPDWRLKDSFWKCWHGQRVTTRRGLLRDVNLFGFAEPESTFRKAIRNPYSYHRSQRWLECIRRTWQKCFVSVMAVPWVNISDNCGDLQYKSIVEVLTPALQKSEMSLVIRQYLEFKADSRTSPIITEIEMNSPGYKLLSTNRIEQAIEIFKLNVESYPHSANAYDSLGDAYAKIGNTELAIKNYRRAVELNPGDEFIAHKLRQLIQK